MQSSVSLGDGRIDSIGDLVIVKPETFDISKTKEIAEELSKVNAKFKKVTQYILCGPEDGVQLILGSAYLYSGNLSQIKGYN